jgi:3',5'-cyclic-AMP phosphodiesterase
VIWKRLAMNQPTRILQLTDLHLFSEEQTKLIGFNPYQSLGKIMALVSKSIAKTPPSLVALTGDVSQDYSLKSYETAAKIFGNFPCSIAATMGNHDHYSTFTKIFGDPSQDSNKMFDLDNWRIIFLNSHWPDHVSGKLAQEELDFLHKALSASLKQHVMIFLHHPVLSVDSVWLDKVNVSDPAQFLEIIDQYQNVKAVICGHVHQETAAERRGVSYLSTPSTSWQFSVGSEDFKLDTLMPGYRWIDLYDDGSFKTEVVRIDRNDAFIPDLNSKGY